MGPHPRDLHYVRLVKYKLFLVELLSAGGGLGTGRTCYTTCCFLVPRLLAAFFSLASSITFFLASSLRRAQQVQSLAPPALEARSSWPAPWPPRAPSRSPHHCLCKACRALQRESLNISELQMAEIRHSSCNAHPVDFLPIIFRFRAKLKSWRAGTFSSAKSWNFSDA